MCHLFHNLNANISYLECRFAADSFAAMIHSCRWTICKLSHKDDTTPCTILTPWFPRETLKIENSGIWMQSSTHLQGRTAYRAIMECKNKYNYTRTLFSNGFVVDIANAPHVDIAHAQKRAGGRNTQTSSEFTAVWSTPLPRDGFKQVNFGAIDSMGMDFAPTPSLLLDDSKRITMQAPLENNVRDAIRNDTKRIAMQTPLGKGTVDAILWMEVTTLGGKSRRSYTDLAQVSQGYPCIDAVEMTPDLSPNPAYLTSLEHVSVSAHWPWYLPNGEQFANATCRGRKVITFPDGEQQRPLRGSKASGSAIATNSSWTVGNLHQARVELWTSVELREHNVTSFNAQIYYDPLPGACFTSGDTRGNHTEHWNDDRSRDWCEHNCSADWDCLGYEYNNFSFFGHGPPCITFFGDSIGFGKTRGFPNSTCYIAYRTGNVTQQNDTKDAIFDSLLISDSVLMSDAMHVMGDVCCQGATHPAVGLFASSQADRTFEVVGSASVHVGTTLAGNSLVVSSIDKSDNIKLSISDLKTAADYSPIIASQPQIVTLTAPFSSGKAEANTMVAAGGINVAIVSWQALSVVNAKTGSSSQWVDLNNKPLVGYVERGWVAGGVLAVSEDGTWLAVSGSQGNKTGVALVQSDKLDGDLRTIFTDSKPKCAAVSATHLVVDDRVFSVADPDSGPRTLSRAEGTDRGSFGVACDVHDDFAVVAAPSVGAGYFRVYNISSSNKQPTVVCTVTGNTVTGTRLGSSVSFMQSHNMGEVTLVTTSTKGTWVYGVRAVDSGYTCVRTSYLNTTADTQLPLVTSVDTILRPIKKTGFDLSYYCPREMFRVPGRGCVQCPLDSRSFGGFHTTCNVCGDQPYCVEDDGLIAAQLSVNKSFYTGNSSQLIPGQEIWAEMIFTSHNGNEVVLTTGTQVYDPTPPVMGLVLDLFPIPTTETRTTNGGLQAVEKTWDIEDIDYTSIREHAAGHWTGCHDDESGIASARVCFVSNATGKALVCREDRKIVDGDTWELPKQNLRHGEFYYFSFQCINKAGLSSTVRIDFAARVVRFLVFRFNKL